MGCNFSSFLSSQLFENRGQARPNRSLRAEREFFTDNLLVRIHLIIEMIWWTGLAPWEFELPVPGSLTSTFKRQPYNCLLRTGGAEGCRGTSLIRNCPPSETSIRP